MPEGIEAINQAIGALPRARPDLWERGVCGLTRSSQPVPALVHRDAHAPETNLARVLLVGGLSGRVEDAGVAQRTLELVHQDRDKLSAKVAISAVPCLNVDALDGGGPLRDLSAGYPPREGFYFDAEAPESRYLWRWVCLQTPDLVLEVRRGESVRWEGNDATGFLPFTVGASRLPDEDTLISALGTGGPEGIGAIPALRLTVDEAGLPGELSRLWEALLQVRTWRPAPGRQELDHRRGRSNLEVAGILAARYGHGLDPIVYTQGVGISGRLQLAELTAGKNESVEDMAALVGPFISVEVDCFGENPGGSALAGLVWSYDLARATGDQRAADMLVRAADHFQPRSPGEAPLPLDPDFRVEDMFMAAAMLGRAYRWTGEKSYLEILSRFLLDSGAQQDNGLFWHCRTAPYFWSRGNGFAALGFAEALTYLPDEWPQRETLLAAHRRHLQALQSVQLPSGTFPQLLDVPGSYPEFTSTCMTGYSLARGLRRGWLDSSMRDSLHRAWRGVKERIDDNGNVIDGCISTGVQQSIKEYLDRPAVLGFDDRSGSLALWFALEMERLERQTDHP